MPLRDTHESYSKSLNLADKNQKQLMRCTMKNMEMVTTIIREIPAFICNLSMKSAITLLCLRRRNILNIRKILSNLYRRGSLASLTNLALRAFAEEVSIN